MFYELKNGLEHITVENWSQEGLTFGIVKLQELKQYNDTIFHFAQITLQEIEHARESRSANKMDSYYSYCFGIFHILDKQVSEKRIPIGVYIMKNSVLVVCEDETNEKRLYDVVDKMNPNSYCLERLLTTIIDTFILPVHEELEEVEQQLSFLDEAIMENKTEGFNRKISDVRKEILVLSHYFEQMLDISEELLEDENSFFKEEHLHHLRIFSDRIVRLNGNVKLLRDYAVQVREEYQAQVDLNLNQIMYVFTIVTVIFLPLTLIVGWYGMNFSTMPELNWQYGYMFVILLSIASIGVCLWYFRKKRLFKK